LADLIQCPKCGLRQTARHAYCSRCEYAFMGSPDEYVSDDRSEPTGSGTPTGTPSATPTPQTPTERPQSFPARETPRTDSVRAVPDGERLVRDRGSLGRRLSTPAAPIPERPIDTVDELPSAPAWEMPSRQTSSHRAAAVQSVDEPGPVPRDSGAEDLITGSYRVRGRPQGELYASERSLPPEDPLMADLVAGRVSKEPKYTDEFALAEDWDKPRRVGAPGRPRRLTNPGVARPRTNPGVERPRTNPGTRRPTNPHRRLTNPGRERPRTNPGVRPRTNPGTRLPTNPRGRTTLTNPGIRSPLNERPKTNPSLRGVGATGSTRAATNPGTNPGDIVPTSSQRRVVAPGTRAGSRPAAPARSSVPAAPARTSTPAARPRSTPAASIEAPPEPKPPISDRLSFSSLGAWAFVGVVLVLAGIAGKDFLRVQKARSTVMATLDGGVSEAGPTADLPRTLGETINEAGLAKNLTGSWKRIEAEGSRFAVGADFSMAILGLPVDWRAERTGYFDVQERIRTLDVYVDAGWELDALASKTLSDYQQDREAQLEKERAESERNQRKLLSGDDDDTTGAP